MNKEKLFEQFPPVTTQEWMEKIHSDLKGADFSKKLIWKAPEGFDIRPFYRREDLEGLVNPTPKDGNSPFVRGSGNNWKIRQDIEVTDYRDANAEAVDVLMKGIDSIGFILTDADTINKDNLITLLENIHPGAVELNFRSNGKAREIFEGIRTIAVAHDLSKELSGAIEADPLGRLMENGTLCITPEEGLDYLASLMHDSMTLPYFRCVHIRVSDFINAGADTVQELAFGMAMGNEYLSQMTTRGLTVSGAASKIRFSFGTGSNYFFEIAKLRAARLLWAAIQRGYTGDKGQPVRMEIHSITSRWNKTLYDPYVNMLRTQTEAMSAVLGGADSLTVEPFDAVFGNSGEFSERIARNQQLILREEAHFDKVADPAAGSYYIENLTSLLSDHAWRLFLETEEQGGFLAAIRSGYIQNKLTEAAKRKMGDVASRRTVLLGTNQYPKAGETIPAGTDVAMLFGKRDREDDQLVEPVRLFRGAEEYEKIRIATERSGRKPVVFLLAVGNVAMRKARAQFSANFFGCAGYRVIDSNGFETVGAGAEAAITAKAEIVVVCSSDEEYPTFGPQAYDLLKEKAIVVIAGNPACADELRASGIDQFIHIKSDVPGTLKMFNSKLGISEIV